MNPEPGGPNPAGPDRAGPDRIEAETLTGVLTDRPEPPPQSSQPRAAVAAIFAAGQHDTELLFIQRAVRPSDPWSGHMAFPGGRYQPGDLDTRHTAERETREEVGIDLAPARRLGSLTELEGGRHSGIRSVLVFAHCYWLTGERRPALRFNHEVTDALWVPLTDLLDADRYIEHAYPAAGMAFPGIQLDACHQVIWGLTLRLLADLFARLGRRFIT